MPRERGFRLFGSIDHVVDLRTALLPSAFRDKANAFIGVAPEYKHDDFFQLATQAKQRHYGGRRVHPELGNYPLTGCVIAVKDNIATQDLPTTCGSRILKDWRPPTDATVVKLMRRQKPIIVGKTNMDEFGMGSHSIHSAFGPVQNGPGPSALSAGGSSGGSAMAVAARLCRIGIGTDTGGSIRLPAAYTGTVGFKPSYGLISRTGVVPYANSLDTVGIIARNCTDVFLTFQALNQPDLQDPTNLSDSSRLCRVGRARMQRQTKLTAKKKFRVIPTTARFNMRTESSLELRPRKTYRFTANPVENYSRRIGFPLEYNIFELDPLVRRAWIRTLSALELAGHEVVPISLPSTRAALSAYYVLAPAEASSNLSKYDGVRYGPRTSISDDAGLGLFAAHRGANLGDEVKRRILLGAFSLSADAIDNYFVQAQKVRRLVQRDFDLVFRMKNPLHDDTKPSVAGVDYIICPTAPTPPPRLSSVKDQNPVETMMNDVFTVPASLAGLPAISVPAVPDAGAEYAPESMIGLQIIGQYGDDLGVINFARREVESMENWDKRVEGMRRVHEPPRIR